MTDENNIQFFLAIAIPEAQILDGINSLLEFKVETMDCRISDSVGFLQITEYSEGFKLGCLISWPEDIKPDLSAPEFSGLLAKEFDCEILCESDDGSWCFSKPNHEPRKVAIKELDDGIMLDS